MYSVRPLPEGYVLPPVGSLISGRPAALQGMPVEWASASDPVPVFLGEFPTPGSDKSVFLFGARYELAEATVGGKDFGPGHFVEYFVVSLRAPGQWEARRLLQRATVTYSEVQELGDFMAARSIAAAEALSPFGLPQWKWAEANWPTHLGEPMQFLGQLTVPDNEVTRRHFTWEINVYLFVAMQDNRVAAFKVIEQETDFQTAEEHYELEEE